MLISVEQGSVGERCLLRAPSAALPVSCDLGLQAFSGLGVFIFTSQDTDPKQLQDPSGEDSALSVSGPCTHAYLQTHIHVPLLVTAL